MFADTFFGLATLLYFLCFVLLTALTLFIAVRGRSLPSHTRLRRTFFLLSLSLLLWQITLFLEVRTLSPVLQLWLGRMNFTAFLFVACFAVQFVQAVIAKESTRTSRVAFCLFAVTLLLALLTLLTPLVSVAERVENGQAITTFGPLFPVYLLHVVGCFVAALFLAFRERRQTANKRVRKQLTFLGSGILATGGISFVTNALLPYAFGNFRFCDLGTLSTLLFMLAVAYATFLHGLFELKILLRETLVYGILLAFVLGAYSSTVFVVTQYLSNGEGKLTQFVVLLLAFSFDPLRRFLEEKTDRLLFGLREEGRGKGNKKRRGGRRGNRLALALLFPWRRL